MELLIQEHLVFEFYSTRFKQGGWQSRCRENKLTHGVTLEVLMVEDFGVV